MFRFSASYSNINATSPLSGIESSRLVKKTGLVSFEGLLVIRLFHK
jgi:hypothetical protein